MRSSRQSAAVATLLLLLFVSLVDQTRGGVAGLTKFFRTESFKHTWTALDNAQPSEVVKADHVCIDMNQILHSGSVKVAARNPAHFMALLFTTMDSLLRTVCPTKTLVLAFDGPAPFTKMQTQRSRRSNNPAHSLFTPGTDLMSAMENLMICYTLQRVNRPVFRDLTVFISGAQVPGEGEIKIIEWIHNHMPNHNDSCIICGSDSDIILQTICLQHVPNVRVLQSGEGYSTALCEVSRVVAQLRRTVCELSGVEDADLPDDERFRADMIIVFVMQGNDYLPKLRSLTIRTALSAYGRAMKRLPADKRGLLLSGGGSGGGAANTFNFSALWTFLDEVEKVADSRVPLPVSFPSVLSTLYNVLRNRALDELGPAPVSSQGRNPRRSREERAAADAAAAAYNAGFYFDFSVTQTETETVEAGAQVDAEADAEAGGQQWAMAAETEATEAEAEAEAETEIEGDLPFVPRTEAALVPDAEAAAEAGAGTNSSTPWATYEVRKVLWGSALQIAGVNYTVAATFRNKRSARQAAAAQALLALDPRAHAFVIEGQREAREKLLQMRLAALAEAGVEGQAASFTAQKDEAKAEAEAEAGAGPPSRTAAASASQSDNDDEDSEEEEGEEEGAEGYPQTDSLADMSPQEYIKYVRDSDAEAYLSGVLWVVQMYADGVCPDVSYSFIGRPPPSALVIKRYIEKTFLRHSGDQALAAEAAAAAVSGAPLPPVTLEQLLSPTIGADAPKGAAAQALRKRVAVPRNDDAKPLSSAAACVCVVPQGAEDFVPERLRVVWRAMQSSFFPRFDAGKPQLQPAPGEAATGGGSAGAGQAGQGGVGSMDPTYEDLLRRLTAVWQTEDLPPSASASAASSEAEEAGAEAGAEGEGAGAEAGAGRRRSRYRALADWSAPPSSSSSSSAPAPDLSKRGRRRLKGVEALRRRSGTYRAVAEAIVPVAAAVEEDGEGAREEGSTTSSSASSSASSASSSASVADTTPRPASATQTTDKPQEKRWRSKTPSFIQPIDGLVFGANPFSGRPLPRAAELPVPGPGPVSAYEAAITGSPLPSPSPSPSSLSSTAEAAEAIESAAAAAGTATVAAVAPKKAKERLDRLFTLPSDPSWVVVAAPQSLPLRGFTASFRRREVKLPLQLPLASPVRMPPGLRLYTTQLLPSAQRLRPLVGTSARRYFVKAAAPVEAASDDAAAYSSSDSSSSAASAGGDTGTAARQGQGQGQGQAHGDDGEATERRTRSSRRARAKGAGGRGSAGGSRKGKSRNRPSTALAAAKIPPPPPSSGASSSPSSSPSDL